MRVVIIEDEPAQAAQLKEAIERADPSAEVLAVFESIKETVAGIRALAPDLVFADIRLADGSSFRIFDQVALDCPIIFTTAYDAHAIEAMEQNAIDYVLKPIDAARIAQSLEKYRRLGKFFGKEPQGGRPERILARKGAAFVAVPIEKIAWVTTEHKLTLIVDREGKRFVVDETLSEVEKKLDPRRFFRLNRQYLAQVEAIAKFESAGKGKVLVTLTPPAVEEVLVSQENAAAFRSWIAG